MPSTVLSIDQGTTNTKAILVDAGGAVLARGSVPVGVRYPQPGWVEQDGEEIRRSVLDAVAACLRAAPGVTPEAVAVSNQRESVVAWDRRDGRPLGPVLGWQDARTADACAALGTGDTGDLVRKRTGLTLDPMFSAPKLRWLLDVARADAAAGSTVCVGTIDAWLIWNLTGGATFATEAGNAARTLLLDLVDLDWHDELLDLFGVPRSVLPEVRASDAGFGVTAAAGALPAGVPVAAVLADSHAALFSHGCTVPGTGKATYGTGSSVMTPCAAPDEAPPGISTTLAWLTGTPTYAREGNILASGSGLDWMARTLGLAAASDLEAMARQAPDAGGAHFVPAFSGLGAPHWDRAATGVIAGVTAGVTRGNLARAALESVAHQVADVVEAIEADGGASIAVLNADGGATASDLLMETQADLLGRPVHAADVPEASARGAALLAGRTLGWPQPATSAAAAVEPRRFVPHPGEEERQRRRRGWGDAVKRSRGSAVTG